MINGYTETLYPDNQRMAWSQKRADQKKIHPNGAGVWSQTGIFHEMQILHG
jgi:hypothetical protein